MTLALVTGGGAGVGRGIAQALRREGYDVVVTVLPGTRGPGDGGLMVHPCDAGDEDQVRALHADLRARYGRPPTVIVNNAGIQTWAPLMELATADFDATLRTNLRGTYLNTRIGAAQMIEEGRPGAIVNIGSGCNTLAFPSLVDYGASKGGIEQFTKSAASELGPYGIRVNCVAPGAIATERTRSETDDYAEKWAALTPLGRIGRPEDVAEAVIFLASDRAGFITGQTLTVDGGVFSRAPWPDYG